MHPIVTRHRCSLRSALACAMAVLALLGFSSLRLQGEPTDTKVDHSQPSPDAQPQTWAEALIPESVAERWRDPRPPEWYEMWRDVLLDRPMGAGAGWFHPGEFRRDWPWLADQLDANRDGMIEAAEFSRPPEWFARLDRDRDGVLRAEDLDWGEAAEGVRKVRTVSRWFLPLDANNNGRLSSEEWDAAFDRLAGERDWLTAEDLAKFLQGGRVLEAAGRAESRGKRPSREEMIESLLKGHLGWNWPGPRIDQEAPDFDLPLHRSEHRIRLADFRGRRPVVLILGSFSCGPFRSQFGLLEDLHDRYGDRAQFLAVYIREAHPLGESPAAFGNSAVDFHQPATLDERLQAADVCRTVLEISMPLAVDDMLDSTSKAYSSVPSRLYVIDRDGFVTYKSGRGPSGTLARELEQGIILTLLDE